MEEHPDCQPGRAVAVNRGYDDDGQGNEDLESKRIDSGTPPGLSMRKLCVPLRLCGYCTLQYAYRRDAEERRVYAEIIFDYSTG